MARIQSIKFGFQNLRWLILLLFPIGWWFSRDFFAEFSDLEAQFTDLTIISFIASCFICYKLKGFLQKEVHLWAIYLIFLLGHYVKFYLLLYWRQNGILNPSLVYRLTASLLSYPELVLSTYRLVTFCLCAFAAAVFILKINKNKSVDNELLPQPMKAAYLQSPYKRWIIFYIVIWIFISVILLFLHTDLRIGARLGGPKLPYKLGGIIFFCNAFLVPAFFLIFSFVADQFKDKVSWRIGITAYFFQAAIMTIVTTSKGPIPISIISLLIVLIASDRLTPTRRKLILLMIPFLPLIFAVATGLRALVRVGEISNIANLPTAIEILTNDKNVSAYAQTLFVIRVNGFDTLININSYNPAYNLDRIHSILDTTNFNVSKLYETEVLGRDIIGAGFSPGLTGFIYLVLGYQWLVPLGVFVYVCFWHFVFEQASKLPLIIKPIAIAQITILATVLSSEGTLNELPLQLTLTCATILVGESLVRTLVSSRIKYR